MFALTEEESKSAIIRYRKYNGHHLTTNERHSVISQATLKKVVEVLTESHYGSFHEINGRKVHYYFPQDVLIQLRKEAGL